MRALRVVRQYPLVLLAVVAAVFVAWIWWDALPARDPVVVSAPQDAVGDHRTTNSATLRPDLFEPQLSPDATRGIPRLRPGMPRAEVEKLVGTPAADRISAATVTDGRVTYHSIYEADFGPPPTVRPIHPARVRMLPIPAAHADRTLVSLEFDASKPGHPLLGVHYSDPLF